jgi:ABC-type bacteriocin/lantibiotic exporter with double-glycine peptidase domain
MTIQYQIDRIYLELKFKDYSNVLTCLEQIQELVKTEYIEDSNKLLIKIEDIDDEIDEAAMPYYYSNESHNIVEIIKQTIRERFN